MKKTNPIDLYFSTAPRFVQVNSADLVSGMTCQRKVNFNHVNDIVEHFDPKLFTPPTVIYEDGKYFLFEGQHRVAALVRMNGGQPVDVYCLVYRGTYADGAFVVSKQNDGHLRQSAYTCINAAAESGQKAAIAFLADNEGLDIHFVGDEKNSKYLYASTHTLFSMFKKYGRVPYNRVMSLMCATFGNKQDAHDARFIKAMFAFDDKYAKLYTFSTFARKFADFDVQKAIVNTRSLNLSTTDGLLAQMVGVYNKGLAEGKRI